MKNEPPYTISVENVNQAFYQGLQLILDEGVKADTRNGPVYKLPGTLITHYERPEQRMLFVEGREANPFFHVLESLWMLSGSELTDFPAWIVPSMKNFSDDGVKFNAPYGHRWRKAFNNVDQLDEIVEQFVKEPGSRRIVLQMWSSRKDLMVDSKDKACNLLVKYALNGSGEEDYHLNAMVSCRSNDMVLGGYGANAVHFSFLQEYLVDRLNERGLNVLMGSYEQISMDAHIYTELYPDKTWNGVERELGDSDRAEMFGKAYTHEDGGYKGDHLYTVSPLLFRATTPDGDVVCPDTVTAVDHKEFDSECRILATFFPDLSKFDFASPYMVYVAVPLVEVYKLYKAGDLESALGLMSIMRGNMRSIFSTNSNERFDVEVACTEWLQRRLDAKNAKATA